MQRFTQAVHEIPHVNHDLLESIMQQNLRHKKFEESIFGRPPSTLEELLGRVEKYIRIKESIDHCHLEKRRDSERLEEREKGEEQAVEDLHLRCFRADSRMKSFDE